MTEPSNPSAKNRIHAALHANCDALMALELAQEPITSNASSRVRDEATAYFWGVRSG